MVVAEVARRDKYKYEITREAILDKYKSAMVLSGRYAPLISVGMGDEYFIAKFSTLEEAKIFKEEVLKHQKNI